MPRLICGIRNLNFEFGLVSIILKGLFAYERIVKIDLRIVLKESGLEIMVPFVPINLHV